MKNKFKVIRTWYTEGKSVQNAIDNTDNRNYDEMTVLIKEITAGEKYHVVHDKNRYK